jgi:hypothetical protein
MPIFAAFFAVAPEMLAIEAAGATAAEIAAAEAAAAAAAETAAATAAAETAAAQVGLTAAEQAAQAGIMEVGGATANTAATAPLTTAEAVQTAAQQAGQNLAPETLTRGIQGVPEVIPEVANPGIQNVPYEFSQAELDAMTRGQEIARASSAAPPTEVTAGFNLKGTMLENTPFNSPASVTNEMLRSGYGPAAPAPVAPPVTPVAPPANPGVVTSPVSGFEPNPSFEGFTSGPQGADPNYFKSTVAPGPERMTPLEYQLNAPPNTAQSLRFGTNTSGMTVPNTQITSVSQTPMAQPQSSLMRGLDSAIDWVKAHPFQAASGAYSAASLLGLNKPTGNGGSKEEYDGPLSRYKLSPDFKGSTANPLDFQYKPRYAEGGGIMGPGSYNIPVGYDEGGDVPEYAKGGNLSDSIEQYQKMLDGKPRAALPASRDVGIYYDQDPDTRYQDALTAAQIRQAKVNKRANVDLPGMKRPTPMGQLNLRPPGVAAGASGSSLDPETAASGGIMHSSLGGYAAGGNPRLLRGPGDGMSDNIPATISGRQPARLADGEFVIPADVVSHLGNGSTEAGAKQLHAMMDKVRRARTGNPKQGKNINPQKYMPKTRA